MSWLSDSEDICLSFPQPTPSSPLLYYSHRQWLPQPLQYAYETRASAMEGATRPPGALWEGGPTEREVLADSSDSGNNAPKREDLDAESEEEEDDECVITGEAGGGADCQSMAHTRHDCLRYPLKVYSEGVGLANASACENCW
jgi:hypothetical protein